MRPYIISRRASSGRPFLLELFPLCFFLSMSPYLRHTFVVTIHAIDALAGLCKHQLVYPVLAHLTFEAVGVI